MATPKRRAPSRRLLAAVVAVFVMIVGLRTWVVQGVLRPVRITESSMAPFLYGEHVIVQCSACRQTYPVAPFDSTASDLRAVCPRCGTLHQLSDVVGWRLGERVLVGKWRRWRPERLRWRVVAVQHPMNKADALVKRVVALPGETVQLRHGDVFVDGTACAKSLAQFREMAIPLLDTQRVTRTRLRTAWSRWQPSSPRSSWQFTGDHYVCHSTAMDDWSWLSFLGSDLAGRRPEGMLILDDYTFNPSISRRLYPVRDILLRCVLRDFFQGSVAVQSTVDGHTVQIVWDAEARRVALRVNDKLVAQRWLPHAQAARNVTLEFALCDGQIHFALNQRSVISISRPERTNSTSQGVQHLEIGTKGARFSIQRIELLRDVYYVPPARSVSLRMTPAVTLGDDQFFVLGDNSPVSHDSRDFGPLRRSDLLGTVWKWRSRDP